MSSAILRAYVDLVCFVDRSIERASERSIDAPINKLIKDASAPERRKIWMNRVERTGRFFARFFFIFLFFLFLSLSLSETTCATSKFQEQRLSNYSCNPTRPGSSTVRDLNFRNDFQERTHAGRVFPSPRELFTIAHLLKNRRVYFAVNRVQKSPRLFSFVKIFFFFFFFFSEKYDGTSLNHVISLSLSLFNGKKSQNPSSERQLQLYR